MEGGRGEAEWMQRPTEESDGSNERSSRLRGRGPVASALGHKDSRALDTRALGH